MTCAIEKKSESKRASSLRHCNSQLKNENAQIRLNAEKWKIEKTFRNQYSGENNQRATPSHHHRSKTRNGRKRNWTQAQKKARLSLKRREKKEMKKIKHRIAV